LEFNGILALSQERRDVDLSRLAVVGTYVQVTQSNDITNITMTHRNDYIS